jgi:hypothetical protein
MILYSLFKSKLYENNHLKMKILPFILICLFFSHTQAGHNLASIRFNIENLNMVRLPKELPEDPAFSTSGRLIFK